MTELANLAGLARQLNLSRSWLKAEADAGRIPYLKAGRRRLFNIKAVEKALAKRAAADRGQRTPTDTLTEAERKDS